MKNKNITQIILLMPLIIVLMAFLIIPFIAIVISSFTTDGGGFTLQYYKESFQIIYLKSLQTSFILSLSVTFLGTVIGSVLAYIISLSNPRHKNFLLNVAAIPLTFSGLVIAYLHIIMLGSSGSLTLILKKIFKINPLEFSAYLFTWKGLVIAYLYFQIPRMIIIMATAWEKLDKSLVEAARSLGASTFTVIFKVILPYLKAPLLAGSILLFAISMGAFGTALALTGTGVNIFPLTIQRQFSDISYNPKLANALVIILTLFTSISIMIYQQKFSKRKY